jgi:hypothetical protein
MALYSSGSLPVRWVLLTLVPDLLGGSGSLGQPGFFGFYNLTEVTSYAGVLPLVAAFVLLGRLRWRRHPPEWLVWHVMALAGVALALGGNTPLGSVLYHLPLFGDQRLQSRNLLVLDLALAVLFAYWADQPFEQSRTLGGAEHQPERRRGQPAEALPAAVRGARGGRGRAGGLRVAARAQAALAPDHRLRGRRRDRVHRLGRGRGGARAFRRRLPRRAVEALPGRSVSGAWVGGASGPPAAPTAATVSSPDGVRVIRAVAAIDGWSATLQPRHGPPTAPTVRADGLVQAVDGPAGLGVLTFRYAPPGFAVGLTLSLMAGVLIAGFFVAGLLARRARKPVPRPLAPVRSPAGTLQDR